MGFNLKFIMLTMYRLMQNPFKKSLNSQNQTIYFSGVGANHQNGAEEREIQTITKIARTILLHEILMWPDQADTTL